MKPEVDKRLGKALSELGPLPVLRGTVARVQALANDTYSLTDDLVAAIERDEAFAMNLLRFANSAAARPIRARSIRQAVTLVGRRAIGRLALEAATYEFLQRFPGSGGASRGQIHVHAVAVAAAAAAIAQRGGAGVETAHLAGLLHDVGKLVLPLAFDAATVDEIALREPVGLRRAALERDHLGVDHAYVGALLARRSDMSDVVCAAIAFHHGGRSGQEAPTPEQASVQLGNALVGMAGGHHPDDELLHVALERLGLSPTELDALAEDSALTRGGVAAGSLAEKITQLERLAHTDELTGLANRRHWVAQVQEALSAGLGGAVLICDVDRFKAINDGHGHRAGDLVLTEVARVVGGQGVAGRLGGDEFALWVPGGKEEGTAAADAILAVADAGLAVEFEPPVTLSIGVACTASHGRELTDLLEAADRALYRAKAAGRRRVEQAV